MGGDGSIFTVSVTANGASESRISGAIFLCQSLFVGIVATLMVVGLQGDTAWPLVANFSIIGLSVLTASLRRRSVTL